MMRNVINQRSFLRICNLNPSQKQKPTKKAYKLSTKNCISNLLAIMTKVRDPKVRDRVF